MQERHKKQNLKLYDVQTAFVPDLVHFYVVGWSYFLKEHNWNASGNFLQREKVF